MFGGKGGGHPDGFFDDLLATAVIVLEVNRTAGCIDRTGTKAALSSLRHGLPLMHAVIGPSCSDDVAAVTDAAYRARENVSHTFLSGMSTAPGLSGTNKLVRTVPSERLKHHSQKAFMRVSPLPSSGLLPELRVHSRHAFASRAPPR